MANKLYEESNIQAIANAIRAKGQSGTMTVGQMATKIAGIQTSISIGVENPETKAFRKEVTYPPTYTSSQIVNYKNTTSGYRNDEPTILSMQGEDNRNNAYLCDNVMRWIYVPSINNARDIGGWKCNGGTIRYGKIFRGGEMNGTKTISQADIQRMLGIGIAIDLDFRNPSERGGITSSPLGNTVDFVPNTIDAYRSCVPDYNGAYTNYRTTINTIVDSLNDNKPVYMHCIQGADRTATVALLVESLLGVSQSDIDKDYELTTFSGENIERTRLYSPYKELLGLILDEQSTPENWAINWWLNFDLSGSGSYLSSSQINAIRSALIDGSPSTVVSRNITYSLTNCSCVQYSSRFTYTTYKPRVIADGTRLSLIFNPNSGYQMSDITVTMGGVPQTVTNNILIIDNVTGDISVSATAQAIVRVNQIPVSTDTDGSIFNGIGYMASKRINSSYNVASLTNSSATYYSKMLVTGFIPVTAGDVITIENAFIDSTSISENTTYGESTSGINNGIYNSNKTKVGAQKNTWDRNGTGVSNPSPYTTDFVTDSNGKTTRFRIQTGTGLDISYIRLTLCATGDLTNAAVYIN